MRTEHWAFGSAPSLKTRVATRRARWASGDVAGWLACPFQWTVAVDASISRMKVPRVCPVVEDGMDEPTGGRQGKGVAGAQGSRDEVQQLGGQSLQAAMCLMVQTISHDARGHKASALGRVVDL